MAALEGDEHSLSQTAAKVEAAIDVAIDSLRRSQGAATMTTRVPKDDEMT